MPRKKALTPEAVRCALRLGQVRAAYPSDRAVKAGPDPGKHWAFKPVRLGRARGDRRPRPSSETRSTPIRAALSKKSLPHRCAGPADTDSSRVPRPHRPSPHRGRGRGVRERREPKGVEKVVDRLLASPRTAELGTLLARSRALRRHQGYVFQEDRNFPYAYTYRDSSSFAPSTTTSLQGQFVIEQLAGSSTSARTGDRWPLSVSLTLGPAASRQRERHHRRPD